MLVNPAAILKQYQSTRRRQVVKTSRQGVTVEVRQDPACIQLMRDFIKATPELWNEDIGV
jgi:cytosine/creatinine deaminase